MKSKCSVSFKYMKMNWKYIIPPTKPYIIITGGRCQKLVKRQLIKIKLKFALTSNGFKTLVRST